MKLVSSGAQTPVVSEIETVALSEDQYEMLRQLSRDLDPDAHFAFGGAHAIRTLLDRIEERGIDLSGATPDESIAPRHPAAVKRPRRR